MFSKGSLFIKDILQTYQCNLVLFISIFRLTLLQQVSREVGIVVPLDHMLQMKSKLAIEVAISSFGADAVKNHVAYADLYKAMEKKIKTKEKREQNATSTTVNNNTQDNISTSSSGPASDFKTPNKGTIFFLYIGLLFSLFILETCLCMQKM